MAEATPGAAQRPLSPHLDVWRWHVTLAASILHRLTGMAIYVGALIVAGWAVALAAGEEAYGDYMGLLGSLPGKVVLFGLTVCVFYHLGAGIRHLVWDTGRGFDLKTANLSAWVVIVFAIVAAAALWTLAAMTGALA
jgi:succinate dehydrogenase / fumarate reductase cytochrome b subunit